MEGVTGKKIPDELMEILEKIFVYDPLIRISAEDALSHRCFN